MTSNLSPSKGPPSNHHNHHHLHSQQQMSTSPPQQHAHPPSNTPASSPPSKRDLKSWWKRFQNQSKDKESHGKPAPPLLQTNKSFRPLSRQLDLFLLLALFSNSAMRLHSPWSSLLFLCNKEFRTSISPPLLSQTLFKPPISWPKL